MRTKVVSSKPRSHLVAALASLALVAGLLVQGAVSAGPVAADVQSGAHGRSVVLSGSPGMAAVSDQRVSATAWHGESWPEWPGAPQSPSGPFGRGTPNGPAQGVPGTAATALVGPDPVGVAVDTATHTVYVANGNGVAVINAATCNGSDTFGCNQAPVTAPAGQGPLALAIDQKNHTLYVSDLSDGTVSMINELTCNSEQSAGCSQVPSTVAVGSGPGLLDIDQATGTVYVPNSNGDTVSVFDAATCNATDAAGCTDVGTVTVGSGPSAVAVNQQTRTVYVGNFNDGTVSVVSTAACNAEDMTGCAEASVATVPVGPMASALVMDAQSDTVYVQVGGPSLGSLAMINGATCNGTVTSGCGQAPRSTPDGSGPIWLTENQATRTVYAVNQGDSDVSVVNAATCNAVASSGCRPVPPALSIGGNSVVVPTFPDAGAGGAAVDPTTNTIYATSQAEDSVSVLNGNICDAFVTFGCTHFAPTTSVGNGPQGMAADLATGTVYAANQDDDTVSVVSAAACNGERPWGCDQAWPTVKVGDFPQAVAVDESADTVYVANLLEGTVSVINGADCNASDASGCGLPVATVPVGQGPQALTVNQATGTLYVANGGSNDVSVISVATCDGTDQSGCAAPMATLAVGNDPDGLAVQESTNTIYVGNFNDGSVSVINGSTCDALHTSGCNQSPPAVTVGAGPWYLAYDHSDGTLYVDDLIGNTVSLVNAATCNAVVTASCLAPAPSVPVEGLPSGLAVDGGTGLLYVTSIWDSDVSTINSATCNANDTAGCQLANFSFRLGGWPSDPVLVASVGTLYAVDNEDGTLSLVRLQGS